MKILVTGGAGFIGSHLVEELLGQGNDVIVLDDLSTGRVENLQSVRDNKRFEFVEDTVRNIGTVNGLVSQCDIVYHLAAAVGVQLIVDEPVRTIETNIHGSEVVLEAANKFKKNVLIASTSEVYGKSEAVPFSEDDDTMFGSTRFSRWSYACSKAIDEFLALAYYDQYELPVVIVRIFNTIGPRQSGQYGMVVPRFVQSALNNEPVCIYGTGKQSRCFVHVSDVVSGLTSLMDCPEAAGNVFNIGSDQEITIEQLADKVIKLTNSSSEKRFLSYEEAYGKEFDDMMKRVPSLKKINQLIGYKPKIDLDATLINIIENLRNKSHKDK